MVKFFVSKSLTKLQNELRREENESKASRIGGKEEKEIAEDPELSSDSPKSFCSRGRVTDSSGFRGSSLGGSSRNRERRRKA